MQTPDKISRLTYFKVAFVASAAGIMTYQFIFGLFDMNLENPIAIWKLLCKSFFVAIVSALILGLLNALFKFLPKTNKSNL
ncbi:hypothetical protein [Flavobacterium pallidum]|uniref:Uncharacterized protein n=1 Tax=Flavobacterium pallidum TaxID=2172098 RepID=A0A2S1SH72_9FLAO|nr:hypothetical protein [Flavobacterium pallidum]AWI25758.1 hypothetical protein HYN49_07505 [Flavobacterium pallidum]